jgi:hypothetical protein
MTIADTIVTSAQQCLHDGSLLNGKNQVVDDDGILKKIVLDPGVGPQ